MRELESATTTTDTCIARVRVRELESARAGELESARAGELESARAGGLLAFIRASSAEESCTTTILQILATPTIAFIRAS